MKKFSPVLLILLLCAACSHQEMIDESSGDITEIFPEISLSDELNLYLDETGRPADGDYTARHQNESIRADITFRKGMISEGNIFRSNGVQTVGYTLENELTKMTYYNDKGEPKMVVLYGDDLSDRREFHVWHEDGTRLVESDETMFMMWYDNGQPQLYASLRDGETHGKMVSWHENGRMKSEHHFIEGMKHGSFNEWDEDGRMISEGTYNRGELVE